MTEIQERHQKQLSVMRGWLEGRQFYLAMDALELVRQLERGTRRDGETPRFHHQLSIARLITTLVPHLTYAEETITAAFLHDLLEDHHETWSAEMVGDRFGSRVGEAVWKLSKKYGGLSKTKQTYYGEISTCPIASMVKPADRAHNLQTMGGVFSPEKQLAYIEEVREFYHPMIRTARRAFPRQYGAYENLKILLRCQCRLIERIHQES